MIKTKFTFKYVSIFFYILRIQERSKDTILNYFTPNSVTELIFSFILLALPKNKGFIFLYIFSFRNFVTEYAHSFCGLDFQSEEQVSVFSNKCVFNRLKDKYWDINIYTSITHWIFNPICYTGIYIYISIFIFQSVKNGTNRQEINRSHLHRISLAQL